MEISTKLVSMRRSLYLVMLPTEKIGGTGATCEKVSLEPCLVAFVKHKAYALVMFVAMLPTA